MKYFSTVIIVLGLVLLATGVYFSVPKQDMTISQAQKVNTVESTTTNTVTPVVGTSSTSLNLSNKGLTKAPSYIFSQTNLEQLDLSHNMIEGSLQAEVRNLTKLKVLNLSNNKFSGVPAEIGQLKYLEVLDLSNNLITGLPFELGNLSNLKTLNLSGTNYSEADLATIMKKLPSTTVIIK